MSQVVDILLALAPGLRDLAAGALAGVLQRSGERLADYRHVADRVAG